MKLSKKLRLIRKKRSERRNNRTHVSISYDDRANLIINYPLVDHHKNNLIQLRKSGAKNIRLVIPDNPSLDSMIPTIKDIVLLCGDLNLNLGVSKYPRELGFLLGKVFTGPERLILILNTACNHRCIFCTDKLNAGLNKNIPKAPKIKDRRPNGEIMDYGVAKDLIDQAVKLKTKWVVISGGEPLLHPNILEILEHIKTRGLKVSLFTNASLLNEKISERLTAIGLDAIFPNISAVDTKTYRAHHNMDDAQELFFRVKRQLMILSKLKEKHSVAYPLIIPVFVMTRYLFGRFKEIAKLCKEICANSILFKPLQIYSDHQTELLPSREQFTEFHKNFNKYLNYFDIDNNLNEFKLTLNTFSETGEYYNSPNDKIPCSIAWTYSQVYPNGNVSTCCLMDWNVMGNIRKERLQDIWFGRNYRQFRQKTQNKDFKNRIECKICPNHLFYNNIKDLNLDKFIREGTSCLNKRRPK